MHFFNTLMRTLVLLSFVIKVSVICDKRGARVRRIVGGDPADVAAEDDPSVFVRFAGKAAKVTGVRDFPHYVFRGIRFAHSPKGKDRFQRPRQYFLQGEINATVHPPPCVQPVPNENRVTGDEDCLFLNIFTPDLPSGMEGLPVVVWIHGGGFRYGSASQYGVRHLVGKRLLIVTIQYRLGSLGFLSTGTPDLPGNAGIWDMALAVQWVRNYIGFFGGNPHKIVVMGHGTGASSALLLSLSNIAKGLTSGVVAMSGTAVSHGAVDDKPVNTAHEIAEQQGCPTANVVTMVRCLQKVSAQNIIKGDSELESRNLQSRGFVSGLGGLLGSAPVTEGRNDYRTLPGIVQYHPMDDMTARRRPNVPLLTGITKDETKKAVHGQYRKEIETKLGGIPNFLDQVLVKNLQDFIGIKPKKDNTSEASQWGFNKLDPAQFRNYLQVKKRDIREGLDKISEATGDALFNLPAFLTAEMWSSEDAPSYLYRFEHKGRAKKAHNFLRGLPLVGNVTDDNDDSVSHGDDLSYIFDAHTLEGNPINDDELTQDDQKVREIFTQMIADFARFGKIQVDGKSVPRFSGTENNFLQIGSKLKLGSNFRFCEMALWSGLGQRLQSSSCQFLKVVDAQLKTVENVLLGGINATGLKIDSLAAKSPENKGDGKKITDRLSGINLGSSGKGSKGSRFGILG